MSFLAPLFLLGALAVAAPILFHLIRRSVRDRATFSSLMFLSPTPPRATRRRKLEHVVLLVLRCLCLLALAAAFARPFFARDIAAPDASGKRRQLVILIDTSASMRRSGLWNKARGAAERYLEKTAPADEVALITFDRRTRTIISMAEWTSWPAEQRAALARERLAAISPGWMGTQLGPALLEAAAQFESHFNERQPAVRRNIVLISDMQEGAKLDGLQGHEWPANARVTVERVAATEQSNAGLEIAEQSTGSVRVANSRDSRKEKFRLAWKGGGESSEIYLPPGQTRTFPTPKLPAGMATAALQLSGDDADFDNVSYFAAPEIQDLAICYLGKDSADDPATLLYYLRRVFPDSPRRRVKVVGPEALAQAGFAVVPGALSDAEIATLRGWMAGGNTALLVLAGAQSAATLAGLLGVPEVHVTEAGGEYALLGQIDFKHPIFAPFDDPRYSDFTPIHFWKHRRWEIPASLNVNVLAKFDDGSPALAQAAAGNGNLLVLAAGWAQSDSQLAVSSKFPPLMETMLDWSGSGAPARFQYRTGDTIAAPHFSGDTVQWTRPDGAQRTLAAGAAFLETDLPGIYVAAGGGKERRFAVNLPLEESRVAPLSQDELARLGVPVGPAADEPTAASRIHERKLRRAELENSQKLWRWFILAALGIAGVEILLAGALAGGARTAEATT
jgi:Mg-chelatase subunit ChlD